MRKDKDDEFKYDKYDPENEDHKMALEAARAVVKAQDEGRTITKDAAITATEQMVKMLGHLNTSEGKAEALKHHALYMGIGSEFMRVVAPMSKNMVDELKQFHEKHGKTIPEEEAKILTDLFTAKVFMGIVKEVEKHE